MFRLVLTLTVKNKIQCKKFNKGDMLVVKTFDGRNAHVWSMSYVPNPDVDIVDSLEDGDVCLCISHSPYFKGYAIVLTHNGFLGYVHEDCLKDINELCVV